MARYEISGQFIIDNVCTTYNRTPVTVDRRGETTGDMYSNWFNFCDSADKALEPLNKLKSLMRVFGTSLFFVIIVFIASTVSNALPIGLGVTNNIVIMFFVPIFVFNAGMWIYIKVKISSIMANVQKVCEQYSVNGTQYKLLDEWWGGCSKYHSRRYFITVESSDSENQEHEPTLAVSAEPFTSNPVSNTSTSSPYDQSTTETTTAPTTQGTTSLFDQMNKV